MGLACNFQRGRSKPCSTVAVNSGLQAQTVAIGLHLRPALRPNTSVALVDLDNWHEARPGAPIATSLADIVSAVIPRLLEVAPETLFISIRLYSGWTENATFTQFASVVSSQLQFVDPFPLRVRPIGPVLHGEIVLATALSVAPGLDIGDTCRNRAGPPRMKLATIPLPVGCAEGDACPAKALKKFTQSSSRECPVSSCSVTAGVAFSTRQQKMVDTLMACDLLDLAHDRDVVAITTVTADADLFPPLIQACLLNGARIILQTNLPHWSSSHLSTLRRCGVIYFGPEGVGP
jgi:hypothetical protein